MDKLDSLIQALNLQQNDIYRLQDSVNRLQNTVDSLQASVKTQVPPDISVTPHWIIVLLVALMAAIVYLYFKIKSVENYFNNFVKDLNEEKKLERQRQISKHMSQQQKVTRKDNANTEILQKRPTPTSQQPIETVVSIQQSETQVPDSPHQNAKIVRYASIQEDAQGGLKIAERVMNDDISKMFMVEMADGDTTATYTFNPRSEASILSDLQTFKNFTEPFTISGTPRKVVEVKKGLLEKNGKFWLVKSKLKVDFEY